MLAVSIVAMNEDLSVTEVVTSVTVHAQYNLPPAKIVRMRAIHIQHLYCTYMYLIHTM